MQKTQSTLNDWHRAYHAINKSSFFSIFHTLSPAHERCQTSVVWDHGHLPSSLDRHRQSLEQATSSLVHPCLSLKYLMHQRAHTIGRVRYRSPALLLIHLPSLSAKDHVGRIKGKNSATFFSSDFVTGMTMYFVIQLMTLLRLKRVHCQKLVQDNRGKLE